ncbi:uncharacterized protein F4807DRAFT_138479 [Annulohypoxylon truncatum]|uniref:uncharacterized protein n=1 Tax=Annulohypoxylon truncatum TaxID=327061 RepID=UPI002007742F|nr:uncharacterized protein F4807DRAFT_138479 [Annulohypoxylon truncatum]KAI1208537.1 hypothetical protein F4807DRAFT_138479 [Annulohypoxylon truncatum]
MERPNKRFKTNDYYEQGEEYAGSAPPEHSENSHNGDQGYAQHSGEGIQNVHGRFHNGRDFNMPHFHNSNVFINPSFSPQTLTTSGTIFSEEEHRRNLLESLKFTQIDTRRMTIKRAHGKTCKWFLKTTQYVDWLNVNKFDDHGGLLWVKGKPGAGKSTLMKSTFSHIYRTLRKQGNIVLSFFFNARGEELEKSTIGLYRSLLSQLLEEQPDLRQVLDSTSPGHKWNIESLTSLLEGAICSMKTSSIICFIDALDECEEQQIRSMISFLSALNEQAAPTGTKLRVCLASRHYPHITVKKGLNLVIEGREEHQQDITSYLDDKLNIGHSNHAEEIRSKLQNKASGVFMWVVLVVDILNKEYDRGRKHSLHKRLKDIPGDLHNLIHNILTRDHDNTEGLLLCIQWVLFARRPLTPKELYFAIMSGVEPDSLFACDSEHDLSTDDIRRYIIDNSKGLAESTKNKKPTIQFIHESVRDFLLKENGLQKIWPGLGSNLEGKSHDKLRQCCGAYMGNKIVKNFDLPSPLPKASDPETARIRQEIVNKLPFLEYANRNILYHADKAESSGVNQKGFLEVFVTPSSCFSLDNWKIYNNLFAMSQIRRYTETESLLYILAGNNLPDLIRIPDVHQSCFAVEKARYGTPIFSALTTKSNEALQALLQMEVQILPPEFNLHQLCGDLINTRQERNALKRSFFFTRNVLFHLIEAKESEILDVFLIIEKINLNKKTMDKSSTGISKITPLELAIDGKNISGIQTLFNHGANPNFKSNHEHPIQRAVHRGDEVIVQILIKNGADVNPRPPEFALSHYWTWTPLSLASSYGHKKICSLLLDAGAEIEYTLDDDDRLVYYDNALTQALDEGYATIACMFLDRGGRIEYINTRLSIAVNRKYWGVVELLLDRGDGIDFDTTDLESLPQRAFELGNVAVLRQILKRHRGIIHDWEYSKLKWSKAAKDEQEAIVQLFLDYGVNVAPTIKQ